MVTSVGGAPMLPYWVHRTISTADVGHRRMYTSTHQINKTTNRQESCQSTEPPKCATCLTLDKSILFLPCKHIFCCETCSEKLENCPICRTEISEKIKICY